MRPMPPAQVVEVDGDDFVAAPEILDWVHRTFLRDDSPLLNPDHAHLQNALLGFLWAGVPYVRGGKTIAGTAEIIRPRDGWPDLRRRQQLREWFGYVPQAVITLSAGYARFANDRQFCALVEHELYHVAQAVGSRGPLFSRENGRPLLTIRAHDVEEFYGIIHRYGPIMDMEPAAVLAVGAPLIDDATIACGCGAALRRAA